MEKKVTIYTSNTCTYCDMAKEYFKANNIAYDEKNVTNPEFRKELLGMGLRSVPVIFVNEERMVGFDQQAFEDLYQNA